MGRSARTRSGGRCAAVPGGPVPALEQLTQETLQFIDEIERVTGARVSLISTGFMLHRGVIDRRDW
jgi:adenylosuccinate synthase